MRLVAHDPDGDARRFENVVTAIAALIPRVEITEPGMLSFLAKGPSRYFGGEQAMAERMTDLATSVVAGADATGADATGADATGVTGGFGSREVPKLIGRFAATIAAERAGQGSGAPATCPANARAGRGWSVIVCPTASSRNGPPVVPSGVGRRLPCRCSCWHRLRGLDDEFVELLQRLGVRQLGQLAALSVADVLARFGRLGEFAHRIASGGDDRPPDTVEPPSGLVAVQVLDDPAHHVDTLVFIARQLADELTSALGADGKVCTRLIITAETDHSERNERLWYRSTGLSAAAMVERARWQLDAWVNSAALSAGVTMLRLEPVEVRSDDGVQLGLWGGRTQADEWAARAVARLATLAGPEQVLVPAATGGRLPGDAFAWVPAVTADLAEPSQRLTLGEGPLARQLLPSPSPLRSYAEPFTIDVRRCRSPGEGHRRGAVSAAPATVQRGTATEHVVSWAGPWPLEERWWDATRARRSARFQLQTASGSLLLACLERQQWWLLGDYC